MNVHLKSLTFITFLMISTVSFCQSSSYEDSIHVFIEKYKTSHELVKGNDKNYLHFFPANKDYRVYATFEKTEDKIGFDMITSQKTLQPYYRYGIIHFKLHQKEYRLTVYQSKNLMHSEEYKNYLFIPFTDSTNGETTYENGRYIDISTADIMNNNVIIDFNKAYNPYCSYASGYQCPIPPKENNLPVAIIAGEMKYSKPIH